MYNFPLAHLNIGLEKIYSLWKDKYIFEHQKRPRKNTVSVERNDLSIFNDEPWIIGRGLKPVSAFFGVTPPNSTMTPHKDPSSDPEIIKQGFTCHPWAVNIPLTCDVGSRMVWYRVKPGHITKLEGEGHSPYNNVRVPMSTFEDLDEVASICLDRPMLVNTAEWHAVINNNDTTRLIFSLRFDPVMTLPEAAKLFSSSASL
jgi:hypothetical protein